MRQRDDKPKGAPPRYGDRRRMRIGILGGSFNPAHAGHLHIARLALKKLRLGQVWLLVSPGNPLKDPAGMRPVAERLATAARLADGRRIVATDIERHLQTRYTCDTVRTLQQRFPRVRFVWLMGADNLCQFPRWRGWMDIARMVPFAVLPRPTYTQAALAGRAATRLAHARRPARQGTVLAQAPAPAWVLLGGRETALSATALRQAEAGEKQSPESPYPRPARGPRNPNDGRPSLPPR
jgi:nicotinate-nucleotide adenylyltransferase